MGGFSFLAALDQVVDAGFVDVQRLAKVEPEEAG